LFISSEFSEVALIASVSTVVCWVQGQFKGPMKGQSMREGSRN